MTPEQEIRAKALECATKLVFATLSNPSPHGKPTEESPPSIVLRVAKQFENYLLGKDS